ncbi:biotin--[acetyl-CoA-carboxylase] ligase [Mycobacterium sp. IDR2000157661]|uniref:biotin--[acetyl-CoA-carboxylase] ligase n=1 Tax=Mycobacterium sp. IDR2000157661 TaxID=2867005 RepID=UPI001EEA89CC|nr:biotin--[acetyl-CoA-carboxylase] ligase [Mycobacterium sp. IDR2000157661]ULE33621.1 biotin--[acetyl-CoA-carboxylase] ligase [Mycobacterium sp. IDR2000157661]
MRREPLDQRALNDALTPPWRRVEIVAETGSTNADLLSRAAGGEDIDGTVRFAEHQTAGRGRSGRAWSTVPYSQISMSVGVDAAKVPVAGWGWLPLAAGVAVVDTVTSLGVAAARLKWPNDVLVEDRKLAGILTEVSPGGAVVVGIGLNVALRADEVPGASWLRQLQVDIDRTELAGRLLHELGARISAWRAAGGPDETLIADYRDRSCTIGTTVRAILPGGRQIVGVARTIDEQGRLCIDTEEAAGEVAVSAGDVVHLRPRD